MLRGAAFVVRERLIVRLDERIGDGIVGLCHVGRKTRVGVDISQMDALQSSYYGKVIAHVDSPFHVVIVQSVENCAVREPESIDGVPSSDVRQRRTVVDASGRGGMG